MDELDRAAELAARRVDTCCLCGGFATHIVAFKPVDPENWGGPKPQEGHSRVVTYGLCDECVGTPGYHGKIKKRIKQRAIAEMN